MAVVEMTEITRFLAPRTRLLGLDVGKKTVGLAISDDGLVIATPLITVRRTRLAEDLERLDALVSEHGVGGLVIGLPLNMDGTEGGRCQAVRQFTSDFLLRHDLPVGFWDERLSTRAMERHLLQQDVTRARRAKVIDKLAAQFILQGALDLLSLGLFPNSQ